MQKFPQTIVNIFLPISFNMCFGCPKEPFHRDGSFEYPQHMFCFRNKKNNFQIRSLSGDLTGPFSTSSDCFYLTAIPRKSFNFLNFDFTYICWLYHISHTLWYLTLCGLSEGRSKSVDLQLRTNKLDMGVLVMCHRQIVILLPTPNKIRPYMALWFRRKICFNIVMMSNLRDVGRKVKCQP